MTLKAAAADAYTASELAAWSPIVPPCSGSIAGLGTGVNGSGNCSLCTNSSLCGMTRESDGGLLCNWPHVECRHKRVVAILGGKVSVRAPLCTQCAGEKVLSGIQSKMVWISADALLLVSRHCHADFMGKLLGVCLNIMVQW
jgi:hypothetical protein